jgi:hypothetical protein
MAPVSALVCHSWYGEAGVNDDECLLLENGGPVNYCPQGQRTQGQCTSVQLIEAIERVTWRQLLLV